MHMISNYLWETSGFHYAGLSQLQIYGENKLFLIIVICNSNMDCSI